MTKSIISQNVNKFIISLSVFAFAFAIMGMPSLVRADVLTRQLEMGMSGTDVSTLQSFLAKDATLYPQGLITGYFGFLTKAAVSNFQTRNGIASVGRVGPATLPVLNLQIAGGTTSVVGTAPMITGVSINTGSNSSTIAWNTNEYAQGVVYYSTSPLVTYENANSVNVSGNSIMTDTNLRTSQSITIQNLQSNTVYYYLIYTTDQAGNVSVTWPSTFQTAN